MKAGVARVTMRAWPVARSIFDAPLGKRGKRTSGRADERTSERADNRLDNGAGGEALRPIYSNLNKFSSEIGASSFAAV